MATKRNIPPGHVLLRLPGQGGESIFALVDLETGAMTWTAVAWLPMTPAHYAFAQAMAEWGERGKPKRDRGEDLEADLAEALEVHRHAAETFDLLTEDLWPDRNRKREIEDKILAIYTRGIPANYDPVFRLKLNALYGGLDELTWKFGALRVERERAKRHMRAVENEIGQIERALNKQKRRERQKGATR